MVRSFGSLGSVGDESKIWSYISEKKRREQYDLISHIKIILYKEYFTPHRIREYVYL